MLRFLKPVMIVLGYLLAVVSLIPGLLVVVLSGYARHVGGADWLIIPASLAISAAMLAITLPLRDGTGAADGKTRAAPRPR